MKRPVPDWLPQLVWFVASIYATGALWYFLSKDNFVAAWLSLFGATTMAFVAVQLHRINDKSTRLRILRQALAAEVERATALLQRQTESPLPMKDYNDWIQAVEAWLLKNLDQSYVVRFGNFSGMTFYSDGSERATFRNSLDGRVRRLNEFIHEFTE
jgi:hypothetical protein